MWRGEGAIIGASVQAGGFLGEAAYGLGAGFGRLASGDRGAGAPIIGGAERSNGRRIGEGGVATEVGGESLFAETVGIEVFAGAEGFERPAKQGGV